MPLFLKRQCDVAWTAPQVDLAVPTLAAPDVARFRKALLQHGVTAICPTVAMAPGGEVMFTRPGIFPSRFS